MEKTKSFNCVFWRNHDFKILLKIPICSEVGLNHRMGELSKTDGLIHKWYLKDPLQSIQGCLQNILDRKWTGNEPEMGQKMIKNELDFAKIETFLVLALILLHKVLCDIEMSRCLLN